MPLARSRWAILPLLTLIAQQYPTNASPFPPKHERNILESRDCDNPCGFYSQLCCSSSQVCTTDSNGQAVCKAGSSDDSGQWEYFTTTYVETDLVTVTSTGSKAVSSPTSTDSPDCKSSLGQTPCGDICCSAAEACNRDGKCVRSGSSPFDSITGPSPTPPSRPTSTDGATVTSTVSPTTTMAYIPAVGTDGNSIVGITTGSGGLSGGAIAGIVVGSLAGAFVLFLLCVCFCVGSCVDRTRALFFGRRNERQSTYTGSSAAPARPGRNWFGRTSHEQSENKSFFGLGKWAGIGVMIAAIALCLGLRKRRDDSEKSYSYYTNSSYYYDDPSTTSSSSSSSNPRSQRPYMHETHHEEHERYSRDERYE